MHQCCGCKSRSERPIKTPGTPFIRSDADQKTGETLLFQKDQIVRSAFDSKRQESPLRPGSCVVDKGNGRKAPHRKSDISHDLSVTTASPKYKSIHDWRCSPRRLNELPRLAWVR